MEVFDLEGDFDLEDQNFVKNDPEWIIDTNFRTAACESPLPPPPTIATSLESMAQVEVKNTSASMDEFVEMEKEIQREIENSAKDLAEREHKAAVTIQALWRGFAVRTSAQGRRVTSHFQNIKVNAHKHLSAGVVIGILKIPVPAIQGCSSSGQTRLLRSQQQNSRLRDLLIEFLACSICTNGYKVGVRRKKTKSTGS